MFHEKVVAASVAVWHYPTQTFVHHVPRQGDPYTLRVDVHDDLDNYDVYAVDPGPDGTVVVASPAVPLAEYSLVLS